MKNIYLIYFTRAGEKTCRKMEEALTADGCCCRSSDGRKLAGGLALWTEEAFAQGEALVFVSATGIAVRAIAPYLKSKAQDPAVIVVDELGAYAISLLSGHLGGANELARQAAKATGGEAVITTATDINGRFAVDQWAKEQGLAIADLKAAKAVSAALLRKETVAFYSELPVVGSLPEGLQRWNVGDEEKAPEICIAVSLKEPRQLPFERVLWLIPRTLILGIGCRRDVSAERIRQAVEVALEKESLPLKAVKKVTSIDIKKDEKGLLDFVRDLGVGFKTYGADELNAVCLPDGAGFSPSEFVKSVTGVDNVCERAAVLGAEEYCGPGGAKLLLEKTARDGVTVAATICNGMTLTIK